MVVSRFANKTCLLGLLMIAASVCQLHGLSPANSTESATSTLAAKTTTTTSTSTTTSSPVAPTISLKTHNSSRAESVLATTSNVTTKVKPTLSNPIIESSEKREQLRRLIQQHIDPNHGDSRLALNRPTMASQTHDFAPNSLEAIVADATSQFGLDFMRNIGAEAADNVIVSPLSMQNLLNMILLGSADESVTQRELSQVLGYNQTTLLASKNDRLKPHQGMKNVMSSITEMAHPSIPTTDNSSASELLNTNTAALNQPEANLAAHLQTLNKNGENLLSGQLNLTLANLIMTNEELVSLDEGYEKELKTFYDVRVESFARNISSNDTKPSTPLHERVNRWVNNATNGQIDKLVEPNDLSNPDLVMVLLNAAHFKGRWLHTFNTKATYEGTFFNLGKDANSVKFMRQKGVFGYAEFGNVGEQLSELLDASKSRPSYDSETLLTEDLPPLDQTKDKGNSSTLNVVNDLPSLVLSREEAKRVELTGKLNCSALMLPFSVNDGQELSMVILLPAKRDGLPALLAALNSSVLREIYQSLSEQHVQVELPKFSFEDSHDAKTILSKLGLNAPFGNAHLDRMFDKSKSARTDVKVDKVVHKAKISVDESGAEAAAASMASIVLRNFIQPPTPVFIADHPFLFVIRHNRSNMPIFMGHVNSL